MVVSGLVTNLIQFGIGIALKQFLFQVPDDNRIELMHTLQSHQNPVSFVSWSPDDTKLLTCGNAEVLKLWDVDTGVLRHTFGNSDSGFTVSSCAWFPDSTRLVCGSSDPERGIVMLDTDGNEIKAWRGTRIPKVSSNRQKESSLHVSCFGLQILEPRNVQSSH